MLFAFAILSGCATTEINSTIASINQSLNSLTATPSAAPATATALVQTPPRIEKDGIDLVKTKLNGILNSPPGSYANGREPEWPKIAIRDLEFTPPAGFNLSSGKAYSLGSPCIYFNATLWMNERKSERIENIKLCKRDLPSSDNMFVGLWSELSINGKSTERERTVGPTPPLRKMPPDPMVKDWIFSTQNTTISGSIFIGSLLKIVGFDENRQMRDTRRFWVVNVKPQAVDSKQVLNPVVRAVNDARASASQTRVQ